MGFRQKIAHCKCLDVGIGVDFLQGSEDSSQAIRYSLGLEGLTTVGLARFQAYTKLGYSDQPHAAWGDTLALDVGVDTTIVISGWRASLSISSFVGKDQDIYSPLFPGEKRNLVRGNVRLGAAYRLTPAWELFLDWTYSRQYSDIPLFEYKRQVSAIGLNYSF